VVTIPAFVWRPGALGRALLIGSGMGLCVGALAWLDSGVAAVGLVVMVAVGMFYGVWMTRRMARYWPEARELGGAERVAVARAVRRGERVATGLAGSAASYARGLRAAAEHGRHWRRLLIIVLAVAAATPVWDAAVGSWGNAVASGIYLAALLGEVFWWPGRCEKLLGNAERATAVNR
jgi:hypothetical protein